MEEPKGYRKKIRMERNIGGARNTALAKANGSTTSLNITGSGPAHHQPSEESLRHKLRDTAIIIWPLLSTSSMDLFTSRTKFISNPYCPNSTLMPRETITPGTGA